MRTEWHFVCGECDKPFAPHEQISLGVVIVNERQCELCGKMVKMGEDWSWLHKSDFESAMKCNCGCHRGECLCFVGCFCFCCEKCGGDILNRYANAHAALHK